MFLSIIREIDTEEHLKMTYFVTGCILKFNSVSPRKLDNLTHEFCTLCFDVYFCIAWNVLFIIGQ